MRPLEEERFAQFVLTVSEPTSVLPAIASRCMREHFTMPGYPQRLRDLTDAGMSMSAAAHAAVHMERGYSVEDTPNANAYNRARSLLEAARLDDIETAIPLFDAFDARDVSALRELLAADGDFEIAAATTEAVTPRGVATIAFYRSSLKWGSLT